MNCYAGLAKRLIKLCFPRVIPVPQVEPLDAKNIIKQELKNVNTNKACFALGDAHERLFKPKPSMNEYEAWVAAVAWAEAKAQERETAHQASCVSSEHTNTDDDSDNSIFGSHLGEESKCPSYASVVGSNMEG